MGRHKSHSHCSRTPLDTMHALYKLTALVALALSCWAQLSPEECAPLSDTLLASEMDKIYGQWVLVAAFADFEAGVAMIGNISTSHLNLSLNAENQAVHYHEMNRDLNGVCVGPLVRPQWWTETAQRSLCILQIS